MAAMKICAILFLAYLIIYVDAKKKGKGGGKKKNGLCKQVFDKISEIEKMIEDKYDCCARVPPTEPPKPASSCKEIYDKDNNSQNGPYNLQLGDEELSVYCDMNGADLGECGAGGWTLVMKTDGNKDTFQYDASFWSGMTSFQPVNGQTGLDNDETFLPSYWTTPFTKICLGMSVNGVARFIRVDQEAASLYDLVADGTPRPTSLGRDKWKSLLGNDASLQINCGREGFNSRSAQSERHSMVRIGIIGNNENDCITPDSRIGFGGAGYPDDTNTCGNEALWFPDNGDQHIKAFGYVFVQ